MSSTSATFIDPTRGAHPISARRDADRLLVAPESLAAATGWVLKPEGLCRDDVCVPVRDRSALVADGAIDLAAFGAVLHRAVVVDAAEGVAAIGAPPAERAATTAAPDASDFELPDLAGRPFRFSSIGRKKKLLLAWASW